MVCVATLVGGLSWASRASATSCVSSGNPPANPYAAAPMVFVGTVVSTGYEGRWARVRVEDVWRGPALPAEVELLGSPVALTPVPTSPPGMPALMTASTSDRHYSVGERYLFVPSGPADTSGRAGGPPRFLDYAGCGDLTRPYSPDLEALRPEGSKLKATAAQRVAGLTLRHTVGPDTIGPVALLALAAAGVAVRARRRRTRRVRSVIAQAV